MVRHALRIVFLVCCVLCPPGAPADLLAQTPLPEPGKKGRANFVVEELTTKAFRDKMADGGGQLHVLLVMDTDDPEIGRSVAVDLGGLQEMLRAAFAGMETRYSITVLSGERASPKAVREHYRALRASKKVGRNDTVFCFCSGHGAVDSNEGHYLSFGTRGTLRRSELRSMIAALEPRSIILLTDCCAGLTELPVELHQKLGSGASPSKQVNKELVCRLMLGGHPVTVDMTSSRVGTYAHGNVQAGGFFTAAFLGACYENSTWDWKEMCQRTAQGTRAWDGKQEPQVFELVTR